MEIYIHRVDGDKRGQDDAGTGTHDGGTCVVSHRIESVSGRSSIIQRWCTYGGIANRAVDAVALAGALSFFVSVRVGAVTECKWEGAGVVEGEGTGEDVGSGGQA